MPATWIFLALASTIISALVNLLDSHYMTQRMPGWRAYILLCDVLTLPFGIALLFIFPLPHGLGFAPIAAIVASTLTSSLAVILVLEAMKSQHISRVSPLMSTSPVFVGMLAFLFLGERFALQQVLGIGGVVTGAVLISFKWDEAGGAHFHLRPTLILLAAAMLVAVSNVTNKYALGYMSYWNSDALICVISSVLFFAVCIRRSVLREIAGLRQRNATIAVALGNQAVALAAMVLAYAALQFGPAALNSAVFNSKPLFVFVFSMIVGHLFPRFLPSEIISRKALLIKSAATLAIVGGLVVILI